MKKIILLTSTLLLSFGAWANSQESLDYCKHKYEQVTMDVAYEQIIGCNYSEQTKKWINQNRENTYLNCEKILDEKTRNEIGKQSLVLSKIMASKMGEKEACKMNESLYPSQISN